MKQLIIISISALSIVVLAGCGGKPSVTPSQNSALNNISNSTIDKKPGYMQENLDEWLTNDWSPTVEKDEEIREKYMKIEKPLEDSDSNNTKPPEVKYVDKNDRYPTLQEYVDKAVAYSKAQDNNDSNSLVKKMQSMPAIGK